MSEVLAPVVEVLPDVTGLDRTFDYYVPDDLVGAVEIGSRVRVDLNGRRVGGWIVARRPAGAGDDTQKLKPILKSSGIGPDADMVDLCAWAAWRWCTGRRRPFLVAASPDTVVQRPAPGRRTRVVVEPFSPAALELLDDGGGVMRLPPSSDQLPAILAAARRGPTLVVCASVDSSRVLAARLRRSGVSVAAMPDDWASARGGVDVTIGARTAAFAPCPNMSSAVLLDEQEDTLQEERMPTWHARDVLAERCWRAGVPLLIVSPTPTVVALHNRTLRAPSRERERAGWPDVVITDMSAEPPWSRSMLSSELISQLRDESKRVACIANSKGMARLLACRSCRSLARCETCAASVSESVEGRLECLVCGSSRPKICAVCSSGVLLRLRPGVSRLREEIEKAAARPVIAVEGRGESFDDSGVDVFVGTQAILHRVRNVDVVAFLDFDRELLAPRFRAHEQALALLAGAARLLGARARGGRIIVHTTLLDHEVIRAAFEADPSLVAQAETKRRAELHLPPFSALALVEGEGRDEFAAALGHESGVAVIAHREALLVRAESHAMLSQACENVPRAIMSKVRIEVDPRSV